MPAAKINAVKWAKEQLINVYQQFFGVPKYYTLPQKSDSMETNNWITASGATQMLSMYDQHM